MRLCRCVVYIKENLATVITSYMAQMTRRSMQPPIWANDTFKHQNHVSTSSSMIAVAACVMRDLSSYAKSPLVQAIDFIGLSILIITEI